MRGSLGMRLDACGGSLGMRLDACGESLGMRLDACGESLHGNGKLYRWNRASPMYVDPCVLLHM